MRARRGWVAVGVLAVCGWGCTQPLCGIEALPDSGLLPGTDRTVVGLALGVEKPSFPQQEGYIRDYEIYMGTKVELPSRSEAPQDRKIAYTAALAVNVASVPAKVEQAIRTAVEMGGYMSERGDRKLTVRVPVDRFEEYLAAIEALGTVINRLVRGKDVTEEYQDLEIRLKNGEKALERLRALLERAEGVKDVLEIEKEIQRVTTEIETLKGRIRYLSEVTALATVEVLFIASDQAPAAPGRRCPFPWVRRLGVEKVLR